MTVSRFSRRKALVLLGAGLVSTRAFAVPARPSIADPSAPYRVPGGRIGFQRPQGIAPSTNGWILQSDDHTFQVRIQEALVFPGQPNPLWDKDAGNVLTGTPATPGFSARRFVQKRADKSSDNRTESIVLADDTWLGEVSVYISNLSDEAETVGGAPPAAGPATGATAAPSSEAAGLVARWTEAANLVLGSITVRPPLAATAAMAEFGLGLDAAGLNPRFAGDTLLLSAQAPRNGGELLGDGMAHIALPAVSNLDYIAEDANAELFEFFSTTFAEVQGGACRGVQLPEKKKNGGRFSTSIRVFGKRRQQEMIATYPAAERAASLETLNQAFRSLRFLEEG